MGLPAARVGAGTTVADIRAYRAAAAVVVAVRVGGGRADGLLVGRQDAAHTVGGYVLSVSCVEITEILARLLADLCLWVCGFRRTFP